MVKDIRKVVRHTDQLVGTIKSNVQEQKPIHKGTKGETSAETNKSMSNSGGRWQLAQRCILNNDFSIRDVEGLSNAIKYDMQIDSRVRKINTIGVFVLIKRLMMKIKIEKTKYYLRLWYQIIVIKDSRELSHVLNF